MDVTTGSSVFPTLLFYQLIPPREVLFYTVVLRSNLAPDRQYQRTTTTTSLLSRTGWKASDFVTTYGVAGTVGVVKFKAIDAVILLWPVGRKSLMQRHSLKCVYLL